MLPLLASVVVVSFSGVMAPGPMLAVLLAKSCRSGWAGTWMSLGHAVVEIPLILVIYFGFGRLFQNDLTQIVVSLLGGSMIIWMGVSLFRSRRVINTGERESTHNAFVAGILMTALNPFFLLWWATVGIMWTMKFVDYGIPGLVIFIVVHWMCDLVWLSFVSVTVYRSRSLWRPAVQEWIFIVCSVMIAGFGAWFMYSGIQRLLAGAS
ncbi:MAG: LysE family transporter [Dehalococcoidales bacterium]|nr:LysE family transporter [Dehalococcoidales bacterium]